MGIRCGHRCDECGYESRILCADAEELLGFRVGLRALVSNKDGRLSTVKGPELINAFIQHPLGCRLRRLRQAVHP